MSNPKRYSFWGLIVHLPGGGVRPEVHFKVDEDGLFVGYPDYQKLQAEVERLRASSFVTAVPVEQYERLRKVGDEMATLFGGDYSDNDGVCYDRKWQSAKEGKQP